MQVAPAPWSRGSTCHPHLSVPTVRPSRCELRCRRLHLSTQLSAVCRRSSHAAGPNSASSRWQQPAGRSQGRSPQQLGTGHRARASPRESVPGQIALDEMASSSATLAGTTARRVEDSKKTRRNDDATRTIVHFRGLSRVCAGVDKRTTRASPESRGLLATQAPAQCCRRSVQRWCSFRWHDRHGAPSSRLWTTACRTSLHLVLATCGAHAQALQARLQLRQRARRRHAPCARVCCAGRRGLRGRPQPRVRRLRASRLCASSERAAEVGVRACVVAAAGRC